MTKRVVVAAMAAWTGLAAGGGSGAGAATPLTVTYMESGTYDAAAKRIAAEFGQANDAEVKVVAFPWAVLRQNNTTDLITGAGQYQVMSGGYYLADVYENFAPLDEFIKRDDYAKGMIAGLMEPGRSEWLVGKQIGVPYGIDAYGLMVNTELLAKAGVQPEFASWPEVVAACGKLKAAAPDVACLSHSTGNPEQIGAFFFSAYDGGFVTPAGGYQLEVPAATAAAGQIGQVWKHLPPGGQAMTFDEAERLFADGKAAMLVDWPSFSTKMLDDPAKSKVVGKWTMVRFPGQGFPWLSLWQQFVPTGTADKELAWKWIKAFAGPENAKRNYQEHGINPVWLAVYEDPALQEKNKHFWPTMVDGFARAKNPPLSGEAQDFLTNTMVEVATGQIEPAAAIEKVNAAWAKIPVPEALKGAAIAAGMQVRQ